MWVSRMLPWRHGGPTRWTRFVPNVGVGSSLKRRFPLIRAVAALVEEQTHTGTRFALRARGRRRGGHERASSEHLHRSRRGGRSGRSHRRSAGGSWTWGRNASTNCPPFDRGPGTPAPSRRDGLGLRSPGRRRRLARQRLIGAPAPGHAGSYVIPSQGFLDRAASGTVRNSCSGVPTSLPCPPRP